MYLRFNIRMLQTLPVGGLEKRAQKLPYKVRLFLLLKDSFCFIMRTLLKRLMRVFF